MSDFVFREENGNIKYVGDFESLYLTDIDPWQQSSRSETDMKKYYDFSRQNLIDVIITKKLTNIIEIGCGLGYTTNFIHKKTKLEVDGLDISKTAIQKAMGKYPHLTFYEGNIINYKFKKRYKTIIMMQCLWYVLHKFDATISNITNQIRTQDHILFSQAFLKKQKYGNDIIDGWRGLVKYFDDHKNYDLIYSKYFQNDMIHNDGIVLVKKIV